MSECFILALAHQGHPLVLNKGPLNELLLLLLVCVQCLFCCCIAANVWMISVGVDAVDLSARGRLCDEHKDNFMLVTDVFAAVMYHMKQQDALVTQSIAVAHGHVCQCLLNTG